MAGLFWGATLSNEETKYEVNDRMPVILKCKCNSLTGTVKWICGTKEYFQNSPNPDYETRWIGQELSLKINSVAESDEGQYVCEAHTWTGIVRSTPMTLKVLNVINYPKTEDTARAGTAIKLACEVKNPTSEHAVRWMHNSQVINLSSGRHTQVSETCLKIDKIDIEDEGTYECIDTGRDYSYPQNPTKSIRLEVLPDVSIMKNKYVAQLHSNVTFDCKPFGADTCTWKHDGTEIRQNDNRFKFNDDMSLTISSVEKSDAGQYVCVVTDIKGRSATSKNIELRTTRSEFSRGYSENFQRPDNEEREMNTIKRLAEKIPDSNACICFIGQYGAGKSSAISTFQSWQHGRISTLALPGRSEGGFTSEISGSEILGGKVMLYDFPGLEGNFAVDFRQFSYTPLDDVTKSLPEGESLKCCVAFVLDSSAPITNCDITRMEFFKEYTKTKDNLQMVVLLTKIDKASQQSAKTVPEMLESKEVCAATKLVHDRVGVPLHCIFAIYNYHTQMEMDSEMNLLLLRTFRGLLERLLDIYERLKRKKVTPK